jgi:hypothetical protein
MSDVKKFTGFIAVDGSTHTSLKSATDHSRTVKIQTALKEKFGNLTVAESSRDLDETGGVELDAFIFANREAILVALNQEVTTRKKRTPKAKPAANDAAQAAA